MANHNAGGGSSFTPNASNGLLLPLGMLSSTRRSSNNHAQIHHLLPRVQSPTYQQQQHHHHHINHLSTHHQHHHHQQASPSVSQLPPLRSSSAMPQVNSRPQVRRRSNSVTAYNNISSISSSNNNNNDITTHNTNSSSTTSNNSSPVRPIMSPMADGRVSSSSSSSVTHSSSPKSMNDGSLSTVAGLPVGRPDMAYATISPRIRRLVGSASSSRGAPSVSSSSSSGGDEHHRNRRPSASSSHGRRRLSLDLSSIVPDHRRLRESLRERNENVGHNSSSIMSLNIGPGVSGSGSGSGSSGNENSRNDASGKSSGVVASTSSIATPSPPPALDLRPALNPISSCPVVVPTASSSRAPLVPPKSTNATSPIQASVAQISQSSTERETQVSVTDTLKLKGKEVDVKHEEPQDTSKSSDLYTAKNASSNSGVPASAAEMLSELEKELTCSICQSLYLNPVTLDCLHSYCGSCAKEWFEPPPTSLSSASPTERGCPTCRQPVKTIKASAHLNSLTTIFLRHNPHLQRSQQELAELAKIYSPGDEILLERERTGHHRRDRNGDTRRAGDGWWDGLIEEREREEDEALQAAVRESMRDLYENSQSNRRRSGYQSLISGRLGRSSGSHFSSSRSLQQSLTGPITLGLTDRMDREIAGVNVIPPPPPGALVSASRSTAPPRELQISCDSCGKSSIHTSVHFHCKQCRDDDFDLCLSCVRRGDRCQAGPSQVHDLEPRKFNPVTNKLEKGFFCDNEFCSKNINDMFWHCRICNGGKWDYCTACVNRGDCCSHDLEAMSCSPAVLAETGISSSTADNSSSSRPSASGAEASSNTLDDLTTPLGIARPLKLSTRCDLCHQHILSREEYFHCPSCQGGDWDCHRSCLQTINPSISSSQFQCPQSHSLQVVIQLPSPDNSQNPSTYLRRILTAAERPLAQRSYTYKASHGATVTLEPPKGEDGKCQKAQAIWAYWPETSRGDAGDELGFPRSAVIDDVLMVNREWWWGSYSGRQGLFPAVYVTLITGDATRA